MVRWTISSDERRELERAAGGDPGVRNLQGGAYLGSLPLALLTQCSAGNDMQCYAIACSRSVMISALSSIPMLSRTTSGPAPALTRSSSESWRWVVEAGWMIRLLVSPILARCENSFTLFT